MSGEIIGAWALAEYGKGFLSSAKELITRKYEDKKEQSDRLQALERRWKNFNWGQAAERYKRHLQEIYGHIRVIGTTEPIPIGEIFTDVYILEKPQAYRRFDINQLQDLQKEPEKLEDLKRTRGLKIVVSDKGHRLYILGKPGAGKTTFMKYIVHQTIIASELDKLPILVTLRDWNILEVSLLDFIARQFSICNFPDAYPFIEYLLESGRTIVLFDGLDEVPQENGQRDKTIQALHDFSKSYLETQILITCRIAASDYSFTEFTDIEMADFSPSQVKAYVHNWFRNSTETAEEFLNELNLEENRGVQDLGSSPLLLSMICLAYVETLSIPKRRVELYEEALDALLKKWDSNRRIKRDQTYKQLSLGHKKQMFARIAADYFDKGEIFFPKKDIAKKIEQYMTSLPPNNQSDSLDGESILETISAQHGILVERARGIYSFSHLTFQEYYTAKYITDNANRGTLERLCTHLGDKRWREVFILTASLLHEASALFETMQKSTQSAIDEYPQLITIQLWSSQRSQEIRGYKRSAKRSLYWFLYLNLILILNPQINKVSGNKFDITLDYALFFAATLDNTFNRIIVFTREQIPKNDLDFDLYRLQKNSQILQPQANEQLNLLILDLYVIKLIYFAKTFSRLSKEDRSEARLEIFQKILNGRKNIPGYQLDKEETIKCPSQEASDQEWKFLVTMIRKSAENILDLDLGESWDDIDFQVALTYFEKNQLFWDCLQVARVENREANEDMILKPPESFTLSGTGDYAPDGRSTQDE